MHPETAKVLKHLETKVLVAECVLRHSEALEGQYIVTCQGIPVNPQATNCFTGLATDVARFTKSEAERIAPTVRNGNGVPGEAVLLVDAIRQEHAQMRETLMLLRAVT